VRSRCSIGTTADVGQLETRNDGAALLVRIQAQQAGLGQVVEVVPGGLRQRPLLSKSAEGDVDQVGLYGFQAVVIQAPLGHHSRPELLYQYIHFSDLSQHGFLALRGGVIHRPHLLAVVEGLVKEAFSPGKRRLYARHIAALRMLYLDDRRSPLRQPLRTQRPRQQAGEVEEGNVVEYFHLKLAVSS